jgi:hypothetical protein
MLDQGLIDEFQLDWKLAGKSAKTAEAYARSLKLLSGTIDQFTLSAVKSWVAATLHNQLTAITRWRKVVACRISRYRLSLSTWL